MPSKEPRGLASLIRQKALGRDPQLSGMILRADLSIMPGNFHPYLIPGGLLFVF